MINVKYFIIKKKDYYVIKICNCFKVYVKDWVWLVLIFLWVFEGVYGNKVWIINKNEKKIWWIDLWWLSMWNILIMILIFMNGF